VDENLSITISAETRKRRFKRRPVKSRLSKHHLALNAVAILIPNVGQLPENLRGEPSTVGHARRQRCEERALSINCGNRHYGPHA